MVDDMKRLLKTAYEQGASDLHIIVASPPVLRIDGKLQPVSDTPLTTEDTEKMARGMVTDAQWEMFQEQGEIDFAFRLENVSRFRVNMFRQRDAISIALRVIPNRIPSLRELNMPSILQDFAMNRQGLILVTGPTGSGKSTTLAAMIDYVNERDSKHIITLEDPIEYEHLHKKSIVNQREIGVDTNSFATGLRSALRQDPDIILVGELRDYETMSIAINAAETGHLVLATLHTSSAVQTINRIIGVFPPEEQNQVHTRLSMVLVGSVAQRLLPTYDGYGRVAATEVLVNVPSVANLIRNGKIEQIDNVMQTGKQDGMHTMEDSLHKLVASGRIDPDILGMISQEMGDG